MGELSAVVLAAGQGTRMKSKLPKVLHKVCGVPMVNQVIRIIKNAGCTRCIAVTGFKEELVRKSLGDSVSFVHQTEQLGTGHAVMQAMPLLESDEDGYVLVICGDTPLLRAETIRHLIDVCIHNRASATVLTARLDNPFGYGRVIRDKDGHMQRIVEQKDGTESELAVNEINTGTYCFHVADLVDALHKIDNHNAQQEYYLTDVFGIMIQENKQVIPVVAEDADETMGVNSRRQLATANKVLYLRKAEELMDQGITIVSPENTYIGQDVMVGHDTTILPGTILSGNTRVGEDCVIGPDTQLDNVTCGNGNTLNRVYAHDCTIGNNNTMGPFVHLRPDTDIHNHVKIGNFVEVKNSVVDDGTKLPHLIYCGDADLGKKVNFGCGTVTVNFDGTNKHRTVVEDHAFIGCNTNLVAPVHVGKNAFTAAGSTITEDVPDNALAIARQRQTNKINWVTKDTYKD